MENAIAFKQKGCVYKFHLKFNYPISMSHLCYFKWRLDWLNVDLLCKDENMRLLTYEENQLIYNQFKAISRKAFRLLAVSSLY